MRLFDPFRGRRPPQGGGVRCWPPLTVERLEERCLLTSYAITDLGTFGGTISDAAGINNRGQVVGGADLPCNCASHPFLWYAGALADLGTLDGSSSNGAESINDLGQVVGISGSHPFLWTRQSGMRDLGFNGFAYHVNNQTEVVGKLSNPPDAFLWKDGTTFDLGTLYGGGSTAIGINNHGWVVGQAEAHAFLWTPDTGMHDLGTLGGIFGGTSAASAINDLGQIVGDAYSFQLGTTHAAYFTRQGVIDLGTLGGVSQAYAVNNLGQVVGDAYTAGGPHAFITDLHGGPMVDLNTLIPPNSGWDDLFGAYGINDAGQIVGAGAMPGYDIVHAYLLTPDDPPAAALGTAASALGGARSLTADTPGWTADQPGVRRLLPPAQATEDRALPPSTAGLVTGALVGMPQAEPAASANGWPDPLRDALAR